MINLSTNQYWNFSLDMIISAENTQISSKKNNICRYWLAVSQTTKKCPICHSEFNRKENLKRHIQHVHDGKKSHGCPLCENKFTTKQAVKRHLNSVHKGEVPLTGKSVSEWKILIHLIIHFSLRDYFLLYCPKSQQGCSQLLW